jgi:hypothetical protein
MGKYVSRSSLIVHRHSPTHRYPGSEPNCMTRLVAEPDQPHIRSPLNAAAPISRLRRARLRVTRPFFNTAFRHGAHRFVDPDPPGLLYSAGQGQALSSRSASLAFDVFRRVLLLSGIGPLALPPWVWNDEAEQSDQRPDRHSTIELSWRRTYFTIVPRRTPIRRVADSVISFYAAPLSIEIRWRPANHPASSKIRCRHSSCDA